MKDLTLVDRLMMVRFGGKVERSHALPHLGSYNVAQHSWGVAMLVLMLFPQESARIIPYALTHDVHEGWVGDIPSPMITALNIKDRLSKIEKLLNNLLNIPDSSDMFKHEFTILKSCDRLEFYLWARDQIALGNLDIEASMVEISNSLRSGTTHPKVKDVFYILESKAVPRSRNLLKDIAGELND